MSSLTQSPESVASLRSNDSNVQKILSNLENYFRQAKQDIDQDFSENSPTERLNFDQDLPSEKIQKSLQ